MRTARAALAFLLALAIPLNAETTTDPLWYLLSTHVLARDEKAVAAPGDGTGDAAALASLQADLQLLADGFESFRDEDQVKENLVRLEPRIALELRPFFKTRASSLDAIYRTLAVTDYTWAIRYPDPPCSPAEARRKLLDSRDGLFQNERGIASRWLVSLLGAKVEGKSAEQALDQASAKTAPTAAEYEKRRALARRLTLALSSEKAVGAARSKLYCSRAAVFEDLASYHRPRTAPETLASRAIQSSPERSVFVVVSDSRRAAATLIQTKSGPALLTDAAIVQDTDHPRLFSFSDKSAPIELTAAVTRRDAAIGLAVLAFSEDISKPALMLSDTTPAKDDLVSAIGHAEASGLWTKTSGLVTKAGSGTFQTDAAVTADFSGGPVLNDSGQVLGLLVLRPADTEEGRWPVALSAESINGWLAGTASPSPSAIEMIEDAGTAAILNRARPSTLTETGLGELNVPGLPPPPPEPRGVCVSNCGDAAPRPSYTNYTNPHTSYGGSSYSGNANAELGEALGKLGAVLIMEGIPALFRGISKLFKGSGKPKAPKSKPQPIAAKPQPAPIVPEKVKEPAKLTGLTLEVKPASAAPGETVTLTARATLSDPEAAKSNIVVGFKASPASLLRFSRQDGKNRRLQGRKREIC